MRLGRIPIHDKIGVVIMPLANQAFVMIVACGLTHKVPFADKGGLVAGPLEQFWECLLAAVKGIPNFRNGVIMRMLAGLQGGTAGSAKRVSYKAVGKPNTIFDDPVHIGRLYIPVIIGAERLVGMVVRHDPYDIGRTSGTIIILVLFHPFSARTHKED